ncbi:SMI1/KNR4 family protein [uncultured Gimesia sp.]|uniref:SMI1/KNR4 family protein n=1 Tax=uncultured Gimesia sp. TaxID=1678688 RepID=UPI0030D810DF|tara:strand:- start:75049 stop:75522 length:474 start_codon:yes stop_codon:yes gene_type:complete
MSIVKLIEQLNNLSNCEVAPPQGIPAIEIKIPTDLEEFYRLAGGARLFEGADYAIDIVAPNQFVRANPVIVGEACRDDISFDWFIIAQEGEQRLTLDLNPDRYGRCYDSFWDQHGIPGECPVIALSFTHLLAQLIQSKGNYWYWLQENFISLGDSYD